jgi:hypothetical protein
VTNSTANGLGRLVRQPRAEHRRAIADVARQRTGVDAVVSFRDGLLLAVNLGNDADTTGAIYGQLAGAHYGLPGIPKPWQTKVAQADLILRLADRLQSAHRKGDVAFPTPLATNDVTMENKRSKGFKTQDH